MNGMSDIVMYEKDTAINSGCFFVFECLWNGADYMAKNISNSIF